MFERVPQNDEFIDNLAIIRSFVHDHSDHEIDSTGFMNGMDGYLKQEFCRTPHINGNAGRDHWASGTFAGLAGAGCNRGGCHGTASGQNGFKLLPVATGATTGRNHAITPLVTHRFPWSIWPNRDRFILCNGHAAPFF